jgi:hypothetical protein
VIKMTENKIWEALKVAYEEMGLELTVISGKDEDNERKRKQGIHHDIRERVDYDAQSAGP